MNVFSIKHNTGLKRDKYSCKMISSTNLKRFTLSKHNEGRFRVQVLLPLHNRERVHSSVGMHLQQTDTNIFVWRSGAAPSALYESLQSYSLVSYSLLGYLVRQRNLVSSWKCWKCLMLNYHRVLNSQESNNFSPLWVRRYEVNIRSQQ